MKENSFRKAEYTVKHCQNKSKKKKKKERLEKRDREKNKIKK